MTATRLVETQRLYAVAAGFPIATPLVDDYTTNYGMTTIDPPMVDNQAFGSLAPSRQRKSSTSPAGMTVTSCRPRIPARARRIQKFLVTFMRDEAPTIEP